MADARKSFAEGLSPDTAAKLERAAHERFEAAIVLHEQSLLTAIYLYGFSVEMWLCAAYFRSAGFPPNGVINRDTRRLRMNQARRTQSGSGEPLINTDPHPLVGWARFLEWQRAASGVVARPDAQRLREAVNKAGLIYDYWRPELRYKVVGVTEAEFEIVASAAAWFRDNHGKLSGA